jgi:hypothetical protein
MVNSDGIMGYKLYCVLGRLLSYTNVADGYITTISYFWSTYNRVEWMLIYRISNEEIQTHRYCGWMFSCVTHIQGANILKWRRLAPNSLFTSNLSLHSIRSLKTPLNNSRTKTILQVSCLFIDTHTQKHAHTHTHTHTHMYIYIYIYIYIYNMPYK